MPLRDSCRVALLAAFALVLHGLESLLPSPVPWMRLGLANIITLIALCLYGFRTALMVTLIRVVVGSLFTGTFPGPGFILGTGGGAASVLSMAAAHFAMPRLFSPVGLSIIGAFFHNLVQLLLAFLLIIQRLEPILLIAPTVFLLGTFTGMINGLVSLHVIGRIRTGQVAPDGKQIAG
jgi:heptaprenyl diphosphate synthase